jgi:hypothetical protein
VLTSANVRKALLLKRVHTGDIADFDPAYAIVSQGQGQLDSAEHERANAHRVIIHAARDRFMIWLVGIRTWKRALGQPALAAVKAGRTKPARQVFARWRRKHAIPD